MKRIRPKQSSTRKQRHSFQSSTNSQEITGRSRETPSRALLRSAPITSKRLLRRECQKQYCDYQFCVSMVWGWLTYPRAISRQSKIKLKPTVNSPLQKREGNQSQNVSRNCFWDRYCGRTGQLLAIVTVPEVFAKVNSVQFPFHF